MARTKPRAAQPASGHGEPFFDSRDAHRGKKRRAVAASARTSSARRSLVRRLGPQAVLEVDPDTGTPRVVSRLDGALTGPSEDGPRDVALRYIRTNAAALGLSDADLDTLRLADRQTTPDGLTVVRWIQVAAGLPAFDNGLKVAVDRAGRVLTVSGSPVHGLDVASADPGIAAATAVGALDLNVAAGGTRSITSGPSGARRTTRFSDGSTAELSIFVTSGEDRLAWDVVTTTEDGLMYHAAVDAQTGRILERANMTKFAGAASIFPNYPGAAAGGSPQSVNLGSTGLGFLDSGATELSGPNAHVYSDLDDNNAMGGGESVPPVSGDWNFTLTTFSAGSFCASATPCTWNSSTPSSWSTNRQQNATQVFWFVNTFHDHLAASPINFTAASGAFENADALIAESDDGAATSGGTLPDSNHLNNANMITPKDGTAPRMQMYLFSDGGSPSPLFRDVNGGDTAAIVYHEYSHGLSNRLVVTPAGNGALDSAQAGAMGEAWSDWYAMDFLVQQGYEADTPGSPGDIVLSEYTDATPNTIRSQPMDCAVTDSAPTCPGDGSAGTGGYTYGDFGNICCGGAEVHADGEIWGETLWGLRQALVTQLGSDLAGSQAAEKLITDGMRLSPPEPSFLDMRNAILAAATGSVQREPIWNVFKARGMGFFASTLDAGDVAPIEDFNGPPTSNGRGTVTGQVIDAVSGLPRSGIAVGFGGHATKPTFADYFATTSAGDGSFSLTNLPVGSYPQLYTAMAGYDRQVATNVPVTDGGTTTQDFAVRRDWAASGGGASIASFTGPDYEPLYGCGPAQAVDQSQATGWSTDKTVTGSEIVVALPQAITVSSFAIDPANVCGDDPSATLKNYRIETSADGSTWTTAKDASTAGGFSPSDAGRMTSVVPAAGTTGVRFVRVTLLTPQGPTTSGFSGQSFVDLSELAVYGAPPNVLPSGSLSVPATAVPGETVSLSAASFSDSDSAITGYDWDFDGNGTIDASTNGATTTFAYPAAGTFAPKVSVNDFRGGAGTAAATVTVAAAPVVTPPVVTPPVVTPPVATLKKPTVTLSQQRFNVASVRIVCQSACTGTATLKLTQALARRLHLKHWTIRTARLRLKAGSTTVRVTITRSILRKLRARRIRSARFSVMVNVADASGLAARVRKSPWIMISKR